MDREPGKLPGLSFEEAAENVKKNLEALGKPSQEERAKLEFEYLDFMNDHRSP